MPTILHCADLHLETAFSSHLPAPVGTRRRADLRATLVRILALARERRADAVTIAGDLYEEGYAPPDLPGFLREALASVAPTQVLICPGESDPYTEESLYARTPWPGNVTIFPPGTPSPFELAPGLTLWGAAHQRQAGPADLDGFRAERSGLNLLLLHAAVAGQPGAQDDGLYRVGDSSLRAASIDLALLGHVHNGRRQFQGDARWVYPGSPEPLSPLEATGEHHVALVSVEDGRCDVELLPVSRWRYVPWRVDLSGCGSAEEVTALAGVSLRELRPAVDDRTVILLTLSSSRQVELDLEAIRRRLEAAHISFELQFPPPYDLEEVATEPAVRGLLVRRLQARLGGASGNRAVPRQAAYLALSALDGRRVRPYEAD